MVNSDVRCVLARTLLVYLLAIVLLAHNARSEDQPPAQLHDGDRVVFIGGTFIERMQQDGYLESVLTASAPSRDITFRNLGWSGDTVFGDSRAVFGKREDGFKRLVKDTIDAKPTVIVVAYGNNEAFAGAEGLSEFQKGLTRLLDELKPTNARISLMTPLPCQSRGKPFPDFEAHNKMLGRYRDVIAEVADQRQHHLIDLYNGEFARWLDSNSAESFRPFRLTTNGVHLSRRGYYVLAVAELAGAFGLDPSRHAAWDLANWHVDVDHKSRGYSATGVLLHDLECDDKGIHFTATGRVLPVVEDPSYKFGHYYPEHEPPVKPAIEVKNVPDGEYELRIDGEEVESAVVVAADGVLTATFDSGPEFTQVGQLRDAIRKKNELYFHRYRPQNETYLFLFRKHEQGNNAVEIPQFDPLVEEVEKQIADLRKPKPHKYEIVRIGD